MALGWSEGGNNYAGRRAYFSGPNVNLLYLTMEAERWNRQDQGRLRVVERLLLQDKRNTSCPVYILSTLTKAKYKFYNIIPVSC